MKKITEDIICSSVWFTIIFLITGSNLNIEGKQPPTDSLTKNYYIGSSAFMLLNLVPDDNSPDYFQLNFGYWITNEDIVALELKTWKYGWPLGIPPFVEEFEADGTGFPGYIREYGIALVYQRFLWEGLYASIHIMNTYQDFIDDNKNNIKSGYQLFNTYRVGYHFTLWGSTFFLEPSFAMTHRPYHTDMPESFRIEDDKWPKYNFEPGLHFGFKF
jgi:hypothetical protein